MKLFLAIILSAQLLAATAQQAITTPAAKKITSFPFFILTGGTVIIKAQLDDNKDTLNFVFDTGSGGISLDSSTVNYLKLNRTKTDRTIRGIAGVRTVDFAYKHSLKLPGLKVDSLDFHINNYDILSSSYGVKVDGVIGYSFLRRFIVKLNYDDNKMEVFSPGTIKYPRGGNLLHPTFNTLPVIETNITDQHLTKGRFIFDSGAGLNMLLSEDYVADSSLLHSKKKLYATQAQGLGGKKTMNITVLKKITIGSYTFRQVPVYIFNDDYNVTSYPQIGGVIGNDLLRRFNVIINYPEQTIHLIPNTHFFEDFDYSYTGLSLYQVGSEVRVDDVMKDSPAYKAGLQQDDIIFAINNNITHSLQVYKQALQNAGKSVKILTMRNGEPHIFTLEIKNILR